MSNVRKNGGQPPVLSLCRLLCILVTWIHVAASLPQAATDSSAATEARTAATLALIPSALSMPEQNIHLEKPETDWGVTPTVEATALIPSAPALIPSAPALIPSAPAPLPSALTSSTTRPFALIPSQPPTSAAGPSVQDPGTVIGTTKLIPSSPPSIKPTPTSPFVIPSQSQPIKTDGTGNPVIPNVSRTLTPSMASTDEGLHPIPGQTTAPGDPSGHNEIPEPNFTATASCRGCSPVIEISATGWDDLPTQPAADHQETTKKVPQATITAGPTSIVVSQESSGGGGFVIGSTTVQPGQTAIINNTPVVVQTSSGRTEVIVGTQTVPFKPSAASQITPAPVFLPVPAGNQLLTPIAPTDTNSDPNVPALYIVGGQTLLPGGAAITISGSTFSLLPAATAVVINGQTTTIHPSYGTIFTTTALPGLTLWNTVYTANRAGYYVIAPGTTLIPGGQPVTISGSVISLAAEGTAAVIQGSTSYMQPQTTIVTLTRSMSAQGAGGEAAFTSSGSLPYPTGKPHSGGMALRPVSIVDSSGWFESVFLLLSLGLGWLAVWL